MVIFVGIFRVAGDVRSFLIIEGFIMWFVYRSSFNYYGCVFIQITLLCYGLEAGQDAEKNSVYKKIAREMGRELYQI